MAKTRIVQNVPALILEGDRRSMIVSDIHLGFENEMGVLPGKNAVCRDLASDLLKAVSAEKPDSLILLGDIKSGTSRISKSEWSQIPAFFRDLQEACEVVLVPGNHDAGIHRMIPDDVTMASPSGIVEENVLLLHGHAMPSERLSHVEKIVMGHLHPAFRDEGSVLNGQRVWVSIMAPREAIFPSRSGEIEIIVVPQFNRYLYASGRILGRRPASPLLARLPGNIRARVATLDGSVIGDESILDRVMQAA